MDISKNVNLITLDCDNNSGLDCIQVNQNQRTNIPDKWKKGSTASYKLNCGTTSILDNSANHFNFSVYPNPFDSEFSITNSFGKTADKLELYSLNGVLLKTLDSSKQTHSLEGLSSGSYILQVTYKDKLSNHKIVKL